MIDVYVIKTAGPTPGTTLAEGQYTVTYTAKDSEGVQVTCSFSFTVVVRRCSKDFTSTSNGIVLCQPTDYPNIYGSECFYVCNDGYELVGVSRLECGINQDWSASKPACMAISCGSPPSVPNGNLNCTANTYSSTCVLSCSDGYQVDADFTVRCQANKNWTTPGKCLDVEPPTINCLPNIHVHAGPMLSEVNVSLPLPNTTDNSGADLVISSDLQPGSLFAVGDTPVIYTAIDDANNIGRCVTLVSVTVKRCSNYTAIPNSITTCSHGNAYGSVCTTTCNQGYEIESATTQTCLEDQTWSGVTPVCKPRVCGALPVVANGNLVCPNGQTFQSICHLNCGPGFKALTPLTVTCDISIQWTPPGTCLDIEPPVFPNGCQADFEVFAAKLGENTHVTYQYPNVTDNSGLSVILVSAPPSGSSFNNGTTTVNITAKDETGNLASCTFDIIVKSKSCPTPHLDNTETIVYNCTRGYVYGAECTLSCSKGTPVIGSPKITCDVEGSQTDVQWVWSGNSKPHCISHACSVLPIPANGAMSCEKLSPAGEVCAIMCSTNFTYPASAPEQYICFPSNGLWSPYSFVPDCNVRIEPGVLITKPSAHFYSGTCKSNSSEIEENFNQIMSSLGLQDACDNQCTINKVEVTCGSVTNARRKKRARMPYEYTISPVISFGKLNATSPVSYFNHLVNSVSEHLMNLSLAGKFQMPGIGTFYSFSRGGRTYSCQPGMKFIPRTMACAGCGPGHMYSNLTSRCVACSSGTYQDKDISFSCSPCPSGSSTKRPMSTSLNQCEDICRPGTFSASGIQPCDLCPVGTYQSSYGMKSCTSCPFEMFTSLPGKESEEECQFFDVRITDFSPRPIIHLSDPTLMTFTFMSWFSSVSTSEISTLTFSIGSDPTEDAFLAFDTIRILIKPGEINRFSKLR
ncbi:sushi, von Willebrand factor type A, EGF and pentraxin domain-containing protein 1-like [Physella acuta]|uniref:sushi, von Willebrand factor type A, EGF and pentraxin domain-containing protein 1-like n=1 Tax=Physella acuta TaxID=109671 RepID=UPI0027DE55FE|nr:sushi, von Willebrand factor type A, EGF and pentraxin domain-containing protein 1-like [Physella acuta]